MVQNRNAIILSVATGLLLLTFALPMMGFGAGGDTTWGYWWGAAGGDESDGWFAAEKTDGFFPEADRAIDELRAGFVFAILATLAGAAATVAAWVRPQKWVIVGAAGAAGLFVLVGFILFLVGWARYIDFVEMLASSFAGVDFDRPVNASVFITPLTLIGFGLTSFLQFKEPQVD